MKLNTAEPIRDKKNLLEIKEYYKEVKPVPRNYLLITLGLNTALRISDILELTWKDIYDEGLGDYQKHIHIVEQKTGKSHRFISIKVFGRLWIGIKTVSGTTSRSGFSGVAEM